MDQNIRKVFSPAFKAKVALEAVKEIETIGPVGQPVFCSPNSDWSLEE